MEREEWIHIMTMTNEEWINLMAKYKDVCPGCNGDISPRQCHFAYSTWKCYSCGGVIDSRVSHPKMVPIDPMDDPLPNNL